MKIYSILFISICIITFAFCINRDRIFLYDYSGDLRNRVVGARLIEDGISPYYYKWKQGDNMRYYEAYYYSSKISNITAYYPSKVSSITASPFFHRLIIPIVDYPQVVIQKIWLVVEYVMYATILLISLSFCRNRQQRVIVILVALIFLFTEAWRVHLANQQIYLVIPFFASLFLFFFSKNKYWYNYFIAGILATSLVLVRPNAVFFFLPFLIFVGYINYKKILIFCIPVLFAACWILFSKTEFQYWKDYSFLISQHARTHQGLPIELMPNRFTPIPRYQKYEGIDLEAVDKYEQKYHIAEGESENANFFILIRKIFHYTPPYKIVSAFSMFLIICIFYFFYRGRPKSLPQSNYLQLMIIVAIFGYALYMISDLFSPITRHQYYTVQWLLPLLLAFALYRTDLRGFKRNISNGYFVALMVGIVLNIAHLKFIRMQHTIGEYLILITLLLFSFSYKKKLTYD